MSRGVTAWPGDEGWKICYLDYYLCRLSTESKELCEQYAFIEDLKKRITETQANC